MSTKKRWGKKYEDNRDWKTYNEHLIKMTTALQFSPIMADEINEMNHGKIGQPYQYPQSMIEFLAILKSRGFDYRSLQGVMRALSNRLGPFPVISFSQIRRRILALPISFNAGGDDLIIGSDASGLKVSNRGEWMRQKWKVRRGWIKVVIFGDRSGNIIDIRIKKYSWMAGMIVMIHSNSVKN